MSPDATIALRIAVLYAAAFASMGFFQPFFPIWLDGRGFSPADIGVILGVPVFVRAVASPAITSLADGRIGVRPLIVACSLAMTLAFAALWSSAGFWPVLLLTCVAVAMQGPGVPLTDVIAIESLRRRPHLHYGRIRMWGSVSFLAVSFGGGVVLDWVPVSSVPLILALCASLLAMAAFGAPNVEQSAPGKADTAEASCAARPRLLVLVVAAAAFNSGSHAMLFGFASLMFQSLGYDSLTIGALWAIGVVAEITLFGVFGGAVGARFPAYVFLTVGTVAGMVRWLGLSVAPDAPVLFAIMALHGLSFGAVHLGVIGAFSRMPAAGRRARQQSLLSAANAGMTGLVTAASGPLYAVFGAKAFLAMIPLSVAATVFSVLAGRLAAQPQSAGVGGKTVLPS